MGRLAFEPYAVSPEEFCRDYVGNPATIAELVAQAGVNWSMTEPLLIADLRGAQNDTERKSVKKRIPALVPGRFKGLKRNEDECLGRQLILHDFDGVAGTFEKACEHIRQQLPDRFLAIHTTPSERNPDGTWRLRAIEVLDREATPAEWKRRVKPHMRSLGEHDKNALDVVRLLYVPVRTAGYRFKVYEGTRTRLADLPEEDTAQTAKTVVERAPASATASRQAVLASVATILSDRWPSSGQRADARLALAGACYYSRLSREDAITLLSDLHAHLLDRGDETEESLKDLVSRTYTKGEHGGSISGWPRLGDIVGANFAKAARDLLEFDEGFAEFQTLARRDPTPVKPAPVLPAFPVDVLPPVLREFVLAEAETTQTPVDMAAMLALGACAAATAGKVDVLVKEGWREGTNIFVMVALPPGERKSQVHGDVFRPIRDYENELRVKAEPHIEAAKARLGSVEGLLRKLQSEYGKLTGEQLHQTPDGARGQTLLAEIQELARTKAQVRVPASPRLLCSDVTMEKLAILLSEQGGRMCCEGAEGALFGIANGRYSSGESSFEVLLQGHAGDPISVDRVNKDRPSVHVARPRLTLVFAVQPDVVQTLCSNAAMSGRGLLGRILFVLPKSNIGSRAVDAAPVPIVVQQKYRTLLERLLHIPAPKDADPIPTITLSAEADVLFREFRAGLEPRLVRDLAGIVDWASKLPGAIARIAGILELAGDNSDEISSQAMSGALAIGEYLLAHAQSAFGWSDSEGTDAQAVVDWALTTKPSEAFTVRDIVRGSRQFRGGGGSQRARQACQRLCEDGRLSTERNGHFRLV